MRYFFDNCISFRYVDCLKSLGVDAEHLRDTFSQSISDVDLIRQLTGRSIVYISADLKQLSRRHEARELRKIGCTAVYFAPFWEKMTFWQQAAWLVARWPFIEVFARDTTKGTVAEIKQNGKAMVVSL